MKILSVFVILLYSGVAFSTYSPRVKECLSPEQCGSNECCVIGMNRYSFPVCEPLGQTGDVCLMYNEPEDYNLSYPNGDEVQAYKLYRLFCPCKSPLNCVNASCSG